MKYFQVMQSFQSSAHLDEYIPNFALRENFSIFLILNNFLVKITVICKLHYYAV